MANITRNVPSAGRPGAACALGQLLGLRAAGVVAVEQDAGRDHHERDQRDSQISGNW